jgi:drug/metabolite transporter (DMT)-like permease
MLGYMAHLNRQERIGTGLAAASVLLIGGSVAASSLLGGYPVLGGQGVRYLVAGLLLAGWARLAHRRLPRPVGREWAWLACLAVVGLAGCSVMLIEATRVANPTSVGVLMGAAPLVIVIAAAVAAGNRPTRRILLAAALVTAGCAAAQLGGGSGMTWSGTGLLLSAAALGGAAGTSLLAAPVLPRLGALAVTIYACGLAGILLLAGAAVASSAGGPPILRTPTASQLAALSYLAVAVTGVVFLTWYAAMQRLGVDRTGLFNGLIPIASLAAVALAGTGSITLPQVLAAITVLAGVILGLGQAVHPPCGTVDNAEPTPSNSTPAGKLSRRGLVSGIEARPNPKIARPAAHQHRLLADCRRCDPAARSRPLPRRTRRAFRPWTHGRRKTSRTSDSPT